MSQLCKDRVVVITGAGRGIGREYALEFARQGAKVVVNDLGAAGDGSGADAGPAQSVVNEILALGGQAVANTDDISDWDGAARLIQTAIKTPLADEVLFGRLKDGGAVRVVVKPGDDGGPDVLGFEYPPLKPEPRKEPEQEVQPETVAEEVAAASASEPGGDGASPDSGGDDGGSAPAPRRGAARAARVSGAAAGDSKAAAPRRRGRVGSRGTKATPKKDGD